MKRRACAAVHRHRPWVSPRRTKSPVGPRRLRTSVAQEDATSQLLFSLRVRGTRAWYACAGSRGLSSFSFPRDLALAGHVSPPRSGQVRGGGGGCGMSLSPRGPVGCGAGDLLLVRHAPSNGCTAGLGGVTEWESSGVERSPPKQARRSGAASGTRGGKGGVLRLRQKDTRERQGSEREEGKSDAGMSDGDWEQTPEGRN